MYAHVIKSDILYEFRNCEMVSPCPTRNYLDYHSRMTQFLKFLSHKESRKRFYRLSVTPVDFPPPEFNSSCYLSLALVCSSLENRSLAAGNCAISCREKKTLSRPIRNFPLRAHWPVTCFEAYAYTSRFEPCDMRACSAESKRSFTQDEWLYQSISRFDNCE